MGRLKMQNGGASLWVENVPRGYKYKGRILSLQINGPYSRASIFMTKKQMEKLTDYIEIRLLELDQS